MKNILIVSRSFYPMNSPRSFRTTELVKEFARQGHNVKLLTIRNDEVHRKFEKQYGVDIQDFGPLSLSELELLGKGKVTGRISWIFNRVLKHLFEYPDIELSYRVKEALKNESGYDLLISIAVPHPIHWGVAWARSKEHTIADVWAADCGDPYMGFKMDRFNKPFYFKYVEKKFCRKADFITVPIEEAKEAYYSEFKEKIRVIPQGFKFEEVDVDCSASPRNAVPVLGYAGNLLGGGRNPYQLLEYLAGYEKPFKFVIYTRKPGPAEPYIKQANGKIEVRDYIPRKKLLKELAGMDFLVNLENDTSRQVPSKLIDYYLTGRPVLSVSSRDLDIEKVDQFMNGDYSKQYHFENVDQYRIENVCARFLELCNAN